MGEAKRKRQQQQSAWPRSDGFRGIIDLHALPPVAAINGARIRALTGDVAIPDDAQIILRAFRAVVGERSFHVGFCLGDGEGFSAIGIAVIDRLMMEAPGAALHVVPVVHGEIAWDIVLRHLRSFTGQVLLFAFRFGYLRRRHRRGFLFAGHPAVRRGRHAAGTADGGAAPQDLRAEGGSSRPSAATLLCDNRHRPRGVAVDIPIGDARRKGYPHGSVERAA